MQGFDVTKGSWGYIGTLLQASSQKQPYRVDHSSVMSCVMAAWTACHALVLTRSSKAGKLWQASQHVVGRRDILKPLRNVKIKDYPPGQTC
jgi:hypothetical protein